MTLLPPIRISGDASDTPAEENLPVRTLVRSVNADTLQPLTFNLRGAALRGAEMPADAKNSHPPFRSLSTLQNMKSPELLDIQKANIRNVMDGSLSTFEASNISPNAVKIHMESLGFKASDLDTNGWQYDWWLTFKGPKGDVWLAAGSGYYGTFEFSAAEG